MIRIVTFALAAALAALVLAGADATFAQNKNKKKDPRCVPNFLQACYERCIKAAGQRRYCPVYCERQKRELGCP